MRAGGKTEDADEDIAVAIRYNWQTDRRSDLILISGVCAVCRCCYAAIGRCSVLTSAAHPMLAARETVGCGLWLWGNTHGGAN